MILIADSGSTKTDWIYVDDKKSTHQYATQGINPNHQSSEDIKKIIRDELIPELPDGITFRNIYFYGAGCGSEERNTLVKSVLSEFFQNAAILVDNDLLGAAKALCGDDKGIVAILGTGSNTCYYDGINIVQRIGGWGYILGDEGSGAHLGMTLIKDYLNDDVPQNIKKKFDASFQLSKDAIINAVYKNHTPNRFFASFTKFIHENISDNYIKAIVQSSFQLFFIKHICKYESDRTSNINFVGSIAFYFSDILEEMAAQNNFRVNKIIKAPIDGLVKYHLDRLVSY